MTFSIIIRDEPRIGVAVATAWPGGAGRIAAIIPSRGAILAQGLLNVFWKPFGTMMLRQASSAADIVRTLVPPDPRKQDRQLLILGADGRFDSFTDQACLPWAGQIIGNDFVVAGNILAGPRVLAEMARVADLYRGRPLADRLLAALLAGDAAGGDRRGPGSAAIQVADKHSIIVDAKVDASKTPLLELAQLVSGRNTAPSFPALLAAPPTAGLLGG